MAAWSVKLEEDALWLYATATAPKDAEQLSADEVARCSLFHDLAKHRTSDGTVQPVSLPISERQFAQWRGYVTTQRVVPVHEMAHFESALTTPTVVAVLQVRHPAPPHRTQIVQSTQM